MFTSSTSWLYKRETSESSFTDQPCTITSDRVFLRVKKMCETPSDKKKKDVKYDMYNFFEWDRQNWTCKCGYEDCWHQRHSEHEREFIVGEFAGYTIRHDPFFVGPDGRLSKLMIERRIPTPAMHKLTKRSIGIPAIFHRHQPTLAEICQCHACQCTYSKLRNHPLQVHTTDTFDFSDDSLHRQALLQFHHLRELIAASEANPDPSM